MGKNFSQLFKSLKLGSLSQDARRQNCFDKLLDYYRKDLNLRLDLVEAVYHKCMPTNQQLNPDEMAAVFGLFSCTYPMGQVLQIVKRFSDEGWADRFDEDLFAAVETSSQDLRRSGFLQVSRDLMKIGEVSALMHANPAWARRFENQIESGLSQQIRDQPFRKQPGW